MPTRFRIVPFAFALLFSMSNSLSAAEKWITYSGHPGPGKGKHLVLIAGDDEYRSEELIPQFGKILAKHHGFKCTVLFAQNKKSGEIDPGAKDNIPGLHLLKDADLMIVFARFRALPDEQMKHIIDYTNSGKPILGLRTSTHAFNYPRGTTSEYAKYTYRSRDPKGGWGRLVLGETWISHYGRHNVESTRGKVAPGMESHPIARGLDDIWGPSDVYGLTKLSGDSKPVVLGYVLTGMKPTDPIRPGKKPVPIAWTKSYTGPSGKKARVFTTTMGHGGDLKSDGVRRMLANATYWCLGMEEKIPERAKVDFVGEYKPNRIGVGGHKRGLKPADHALKK
jgi:hypothetical protein